MQEEQERPQGGFFGTGNGGFRRFFPPWLKLLLLALAFSVTPASIFLSDSLKHVPLPGTQSTGSQWGPYYIGGQDAIVLLFFTSVSLYLWLRFIALLIKILRR